jgi:hypothetical protein
MQMSGSIRRTDEKPGRFTASRQSPPLLALANGTALPGPDAHHSGPGYFLAASPPEVLSGSQVRSLQYVYLVLHSAGTEVPLGSYEERVP